MVDITALFGSQATAPLGIGGATGLAVGYTAKKLSKLAALLLGVLFILLQLLASFDVVSIDWGLLRTAAEQSWKNTEGLTLADRAWRIMVANLPFAGGFAGGFAAGFKPG